MNGERYLVTGAGGFIGASLCRRLCESGANVFGWVHRPDKAWRLADLKDGVTIQGIDIRDPGQVDKAIKAIQPTVIYHLATHGAYHYQDSPTAILETNIFGLWNILHSAQEVGFELFVNTGSSSEYGYKQYAMREDDIPEPSSFYAVAKVGQTLLGQHMARQSKLPIVIIRPFSVYGPYEEPGRLFPKMALAAINGLPMSMVSPNTCRDFVYIDDVIDAYLLADRLKQCQGEVLNLGTGIQTTLGELVEEFNCHIETPLDVSWGAMDPRMWDANIWVADISKIRHLLHWRPRVSLAEGIEKSLHWFKKNQDRLKGIYSPC